MGQKEGRKEGKRNVIDDFLSQHNESSGLMATGYTHTHSHKLGRDFKKELDVFEGETEGGEREKERERARERESERERERERERKER